MNWNAVLLVVCGTITMGAGTYVLGNVKRWFGGDDK